MGTTAGIDRNLTEAFGTLFRGGIGGLPAAVHAGYESIYRQHDKKVNHGCDQDKRDAGVNELIDRECHAVNRELKTGKLFASGSQLDQRSEKGLGESADHAGEGRADHDADRHIYYIAAQDKFLETVEHGKLLQKRVG